MTEEVKQTLGSEVKDPMIEGLKEIEAKIKPKEEAKLDKPEAKPEAKSKADVKKGPTIGEVLNNEEKKGDPRVIPEAPFLEIKNQNKELRKELKELKSLIESGASKGEVSESLQGIAEEHNVDPDFLMKLVKVIKAETKSEVEAEYSAKMKPLDEKERRDTNETIFNYHYERALEEMPEYKGIANKEVIKSLAFLKENASKTFPQILEDSYGHLIKGKKTIDSGSPGRQGGDEITEVDFYKANKDPEYFKQIMADPKLKKKYNAQMLKDIKF